MKSKGHILIAFLMLISIDLEAQSAFKNWAYSLFHPSNHQCSGYPGPDSSNVKGLPPGPPGHESFTNEKYTIINSTIGGNLCSNKSSKQDTDSLGIDNKTYLNNAEIANINSIGDDTNIQFDLKNINLYFAHSILNAQLDSSIVLRLKKNQWHYCGTNNLNLKDDRGIIKFLNTSNTNQCPYGYYYRFETNGDFIGSYNHKPTADSIRVTMLNVNAGWKCFGDTIVLYSDWPLFYYKYKVISSSSDSLIITKIKSPFRKSPAGYTPVILGDYWTTVLPKHWKFLPQKSVAGYPSAIWTGIDTIYYSTTYSNRYYATPCVLYCSKLQIEFSNLRMSDKGSTYEDTTTTRKNLAIKKHNDQLIKECPDCFNSIKKEVTLDDDKGVLVEPMLTGKGLTGYYSKDMLFGICIWGHNLNEENSKELIKMILALERKY